MPDPRAARIRPSPVFDAHVPRVLTHAESAGLSARIRSGDAAALDTLCRHHLAYAWTLARRWRGGMPLDEAEGAALFGLVRACREWEPDRGRFVNCLYLWVRGELARAYEPTNSPIPIPYGSVIARNATRRGVRLAGVRPDQQARRAAWAEAVYGPERFDSDDVAPKARDVIDGRPDARDSIDHADDLADLRSALDCLDDRERTIIAARFGLDDGRPKTLAEVGPTVGLSRQAVANAERAALDKLRRLMRADGR